MSSVYNFKFINNPEAQITLYNGNLPLASLYLSHQNEAFEETLAQALVVNNKNTIQVIKSEFDKFVDLILKIEPFKKFEENFLKTLKVEILKMENLDHICYYLLNWIELIQLQEKFQTISKYKEWDIKTIIYYALTVLNYSNSGLENSLIEAYNSLKESSKKWFLAHGESFFQNMQIELKESLPESLNNHVNAWTLQDIQTLLKKTQRVKEYKYIYLLAHRIHLYDNISIESRLLALEGTLVPLLEKLPFHPYQKCVKQVLHVSQARLATIHDMLETIKKGPLSKTEDSKNQNTTIQLNEAFLKIQDAKSSEEEEAIRNRFSFNLPDGVVAGYQFSKLPFDKIYSLDDLAHPQRRYPHREMTEGNQIKFAERLPGALYDLWTDAPPGKDKNNEIEARKESYDFFAQKHYIIQIQNQQVVLSFDELMQRFNSSSFSSFKIAIKGTNDFYSLDNFFKIVKNFNNKSHAFNNAVQFHFQIDKSRLGFFTFLINNEATEKIISNCEKQKWEYKNREDEWISVSFQKLYELYICKKINDGTAIRVNNSQEMLLKTHADLSQAVQVGTNFIVPEFIEHKDVDSKSYTIRQFTSKLNLKKLWLFSEFNRNLFAFKNILNRLSKPSSEKKLFLTLLHQFIDLHDRNLAVSPVIDENFAFWDSFIFILQNPEDKLQKPLSLFELIKKYLNCELSDSSVINVFDQQNNFLYSSPFNQCPSLCSALNVAWDIQIFDSDFTCEEDENLSVCALLDENASNKSTTFISNIPIRNFLLGENNLKNQPFSNEVLLWIEQTLEDRNLEDWIQNKHTFPWQFIKKEDHAPLEELIWKKIKKPEYTISFYSKKGLRLSLSVIRRTIAEDLSDISLHSDFWILIQKLFKNYDTKNMETLKNYVPNNYRTRGWFFKVDLCSDSKAAQQQRRRIAEALLPQETWRQRQSRLNRITNCKKYLNFYRELIKLQDTNDAHYIASALIQIFSYAVTPFNTQKKELVLEIAKGYKNQENLSKQEILHFLKVMTKEYTPTFENLANVMYPFLADTYKLVEYAFEPHYQNLGNVVGDYLIPIEKLLVKARQKHAKDNNTINFLNAFEKRVADELKRQEKEYGVTFFLTSVKKTKVYPPVKKQKLPNENKKQKI
jgi:hypothetical protein